MKPLTPSNILCLLSMTVTGLPGVAGASMDCASLAGLRVDDANLLSSVEVAARGGLPPHCRVLGVVRPAINFELRLPIEDWNGKFYMTGCGGFCGRLDSDRPGFTNAMNHGLRRGYAAATMDGGHWGSTVTDGRWAMNDRVAETDWAWRAVTETARVAKALLQAHYGRPQERAYFAGCSTGGRMALMEAQRFAKDFDGIIAGAPALDYTGLVATHAVWVTQANRRPDGSEILSRDKVAAIAAAVTRACDARDGLADGLIDDSRRCDWKPAALACPAKSGSEPNSQGGPGKIGSEPNSTCLAPDEVAVLEKWYGGPHDSRGKQLYPGGVPRGSEPYWPLWLTGVPGTTNPALVPLFARDFLRYMAFAEDPGESHDPGQFDFDRDPARLASMTSLYNAEQVDLAAFRERGGKLIIYHGWADPLVTPLRTLEYFEAAQAAAGGAERAADFARLFMLPGFDHCGLQDGPGANDAGFDPLPALEAWVERGIAPESIEMHRRDATGASLWSRPACAYPAVASLRRGGDASRPEDFYCRVPAN
ncbi:MAG TPA: tannase/feruloyl esterase family alpha/beta hydrolase [Steroidobacteraceae bacterium]